LAEALAERKQGELLGQVLIRKEFVNEHDIARAQAIQFNVPYLPGGSYEINPEVAALFPLDFLQKNQFAPLDLFGKILVVVVSMPLDSQVIGQMEQSTGRSLQIFVGTSTDVAHFQDRIREITDKREARAGAVAAAARPKVEIPLFDAVTADETKEQVPLGDDWQSLLKSVTDADSLKELESNLDRIKVKRDAEAKK
jgi:hypothetical protein